MNLVLFLVFMIYFCYVAMLNSIQDPNRILPKNLPSALDPYSIAAHNFAKLVLLKAYNSVHKFDIICLSETYLDSNILPDDSNLKIPSYNLVCSDHPTNKKRGGVCIYYKSYLPLRIININYLNECVRFELMVGDKLCNFIALYRSPSQLQDLFESFKENLELNLESKVLNNPFLVVILGNFNVKSSNWCKNDITTTKGAMCYAMCYV